MDAAKLEEELPPIGTMPLVFEKKAGARISPHLGATTTWWILRGIAQEKSADEIIRRIRALYELLPLIASPLQ